VYSGCFGMDYSSEEDVPSGLEIRQRRKRHKFRRLEEKAAETSVAVNREVLADFELDPEGGETGSFFVDAFLRAREEDLTADFVAFERRVASFVQSLTLVVHNLDALVEALLDAIGKASNDTKQTLIKLLPPLAKDVQEEFFPFMERTLQVLTGLIDEMNFDMCVAAFRSLAVLLLDVQKSVMVNDPELMIFRDHFQILLSHRRDFVRQYASEAFAPLIRQLPVPHMRKRVSTFISRFACGPEADDRDEELQADVEDGVARLVFFMLRNVKCKLHSRSPDILDAALRTLKHQDQIRQKASCLRRVLELTLAYTERGSSGEIWVALLDAFGNQDRFQLHARSSIAALLTFAFEFKAHSRVEKGVAEKIVSILSQDQSVVPSPCFENDVEHFFRLAAVVWTLDMKNKEAEKCVAWFFAQERLTIEAKRRCLSIALNELGLDLGRMHKCFLGKVIAKIDSSSTSISAATIDFCAMAASPEFKVLSENGIILRECFRVFEHSNDSERLKSALKAAEMGKSNANVRLTRAISRLIRREDRPINAAHVAIGAFSRIADWQFSTNNVIRMELLGTLIKRLNLFFESLTSTAPGTFLSLCRLLAADILDEQVRQNLDSSCRSRALDGLMHFNHEVRLGCALLLERILPENDFVGEKSTIRGKCDVLRKIVVIEGMPPSFENERPRQQLMSYLEKLIRANVVPREHLAVLGAFFLGQFFVKYSPVWKFATECLKAFSANGREFQEVLWPFFWKHVCRVVRLDDTKEMADEDYDVMENFGSARAEDVFKSTFNAMIACSNRIESHSAELMPLFFVFLRDEYYANPERDDPDCPSEDTSENAFLDLNQVSHGMTKTSSRWSSSQKLARWMELLASFKMFKMTEERNMVMREIAERMLLKPEPRIQGPALKCLERMKLPVVRDNFEFLQGIVDDKRFREAITTFKIDEQVDKEHRKDFLRIVFRILFSRLLVRKRNASDMASRRAAVFSFFAGVDSTEIVPFFGILFRNFPCRFDFEVPEDDVEKFMGRFEVPSQRLERLIGFVQMIDHAVKQLGNICAPFADKIFAPLFAILLSLPDLQSRPENAQRTSQISSLRVEATRRVTQVIELFPGHDMSPWTDSFRKAFAPAVEVLASSMLNASTPPAFLCMARVLSKSSAQANWLHRKALPGLLPELFRCVGAGIDTGRAAGAAVVSTLYDVLDDLVKNESIQDLLTPHIPVLLDQFLTRFNQSDGDNNVDGNFRAQYNPGTNAKELSKRALEILCALADVFRFKASSKVMASSKETCSKLVRLLGQFLRFAGSHSLSRRGRSPDWYLKSSGRGPQSVRLTVGRVRSKESVLTKDDSRITLLSTMKNLLQLKEIDDDDVHLFAKLLGVVDIDPIYDAATRDVLVDVYGVIDPSEGVSAILVELNSWEKTKVGLRDFDRRLEAYEKLCSTQFGFPSLLAFTYQATFDLFEDQYPLRAASASFLESVVLKKNHLDTLVRPVLVPALRAGLKCSSSQVRKSVMNVVAALSGFVAKVEEDDLYADLAVLIDSDNLENDFFHSLVHLQTHRQALCLQNLRQALEEGSISVSLDSIVDIVLPITLHMVLEESTSKIEMLEGQETRMLGYIAGMMPWSYYVELLSHLLELCAKNENLQQRVLQAVCIVVDAFHFKPEEEEVSDTIQRRILRQLERFMRLKTRGEGGRGQLRVPVSVAVTKVILKLPEKQRQAHLPRVLHSVCDVLRSTNLKLRNQAREALTAIALELGPSYFQNIFDVLGTLLNEGYKLHVRNFTIHHLLSGTAEMFKNQLRESRKALNQVLPGALQPLNVDPNKLLEEQLCGGVLDDLVPSFMKIVEDELFGRLAQQKNVDSGYRSRVQNLVEAKANTGLELLELLSKCIAFLPVQSIHIILVPFLERLRTSSSVLELRVVEEGLRKIQVGITRNEDVRIPHLLVYVHHLVSREATRSVKGQEMVDSSEGMQGDFDGVKRRSDLSNWLVHESAVEQAKVGSKVLSRNAYEGIHIVEEPPKLTGRDRFEKKRKRSSKQVLIATTEANRHLMIEHGLDLLLGALRTKKLDKSVVFHRDMLGPFVEHLAALLQGSKASRTKVLGLRVINFLVPWQLESMQIYIEHICRNAMETLGKLGFSNSKGGGSSRSITTGASSTAADVAQECFKLLTTVMKECDGFKIDEEHMKLLVLLVQHNVEFVNRQQTVLQLLRAIVQRNLVVPEIYDVMKLLSEQVFTAANKQARTLSTQILVAFFIDYPLSSKRLRQHLDLLMGNLDFEVEAGRISALKMLSAILTQFPRPLLEELAQVTFLPLVQRLVNDDSAKCRNLAADVIAKLLSRLSGETVRSLLDICLRWIESAESTASSLQRVGIQVIGIAAETSHGKSMRKKLALLLFDKVKHVLESFILSPEANKMDWERAFAQNGNETGWLCLYNSIVTMHKLTTNCAVLGGFSGPLFCAGNRFLFGRLIPLLRFYPHRWVKLATLKLVGEVLDHGSETQFSDVDVFHLAKIHIVVLDGRLLDDAIAEHVTKNLVWLLSAVARIPIPSTFLDGETEHHDAVAYLVDRMAQIARSRTSSEIEEINRDDLRRVVVFKLFAIVASQLKDSRDRLQPLLEPMIWPLLRSSGVKAMAGKYLRSFEMAKEVLELVEATAGSQNFIRAFSSIQREMDRLREERKIEEALERVQDPEKADKKRIAKQHAKRSSKKRRIQRMRELQGR